MKYFFSVLSLLMVSCASVDTQSNLSNLEKSNDTSPRKYMDIDVWISHCNRPYIEISTTHGELNTVVNEERQQQKQIIRPNYSQVLLYAATEAKKLGADAVIMQVEYGGQQVAQRYYTPEVIHKAKIIKYK